MPGITITPIQRTSRADPTEEISLSGSLMFARHVADLHWDILPEQASKIFEVYASSPLVFVTGAELT
jgi:hypothetical protein